MMIDLKSINPKIDLGIFKKLLGDKTHFIYELVQNADDSESTHLGLRLYENELFVWNDGRPFNQEDIQSICSTGSSEKDLTQIGNFGIGFKSVYNYTDFPEIYSNGVCFRIPYLKKPESIDMDPRIVEMVDKDATVVFRLPFKDSLLPEDLTNLENHLCNLEKERCLLFLRYLKTIQWYDEKNGRTGSYLCLRPDKSQNPSQVELRASIGSENQLSETFLIFHKEVQPQEDVVDRIQNQAENWKEEERIQRSREELQSIEVAFKLQQGKITTLNGCTLFAYLPTEIKTDLRFVIQARYQTTPSRETILKPSESPWNKWLVRETAKFLPEVLEQLKERGLLEPAFFDVLPLKGELQDTFEPIAEVSRKAMREQALVPTQDGGYAKAENVFYIHSTPLRKLVKSSGMLPDSSLLHHNIRRNTKESGRCFDVMAEAGVKEVHASDLLFWLEQQSYDWFKNKTDEWMRSLYIYFNRKWSESEWERIKKLRLLRLENGRHVCASKELVFFPPNTDEAREEIEPFLNDLPILQSVLLEGEKRGEIEVFLKSVGVKPLRRVDMIFEGILPQYQESAKPSAEENRLHVRYIFKVWNDFSESERRRLKAKISEIPILRAYDDIQREVYDFVLPRDAYLPKVYTGGDLETYFSVYAEGIWFVDDAYLEDKSDAKVWFRFLKTIGSKDTPVVIKENIPRNSENYQEFNKELAKRDIVWERTTRWRKTSIEDFYLQGLPEALDKISKHGKVDLARVIWQLLVKIVKPLPSEESQRNIFFRTLFQGIYRWFYYSDRSKPFDTTFYRQLKSAAWIPDEQGNLHTPSECFAPTSENQKLLGDSVVYLPADFDISTEPAKWLAEKLDVRMEANAESVLNHLQKLRSNKEVNIKKIEPLYRFLYSVRPPRKVDGTFGNMVYPEPPWRSKFKMEPLIFIPESEPQWRRADKVFWEDESVVFGKDRGYLKSHYAEGLQSFFTTSLAVSKCATASDYVNRIQRIKSTEQVEKAEIQILYERLWRVMQESNSISSNRLDVDPCKTFTEESLIFAPNQERCWWRADEVFWEDEGVVFGDDRGYLKACYPKTLRPFFTALGFSERAAPLDYISGIKQVASVGKAEIPEIRKRIKRLYSRVWQSLQESGTWQESEKWKQTREGKCWLGKKGSEWGFFSRHELVYNDHHGYIAEIFEGEVPFWMFDGLFELARSLEVTGCSQAEIKFNPKGDQEELTNLSKEVHKLHPDIHAFLNSPRLCEAPVEGKSADVLNLLSVRLVEELKTTYTLKDISMPSPNPRPSFLEVTNQEVTLWLALEADKDDYALLIGDALQEYFGVRDLARFTEHLLIKDRDKVLDNWKREGLQTELCVPSLISDAEEEQEKPRELVDRELPDSTTETDGYPIVDEPEVEISADSNGRETGNEDNDFVASESELETSEISTNPEIDTGEDASIPDESENLIDLLSGPETISPLDIIQPSTETGNRYSPPAADESKFEIPTVDEKPETSGGDDNSTQGKPETRRYTSRTSRANRSARHSTNRPNRANAGGSHSGHRGGREGDTRTEETALPHHTTKEIEHIGMEYARRYEEAQGCNVEDVSAENLGFDLRSTTPDGEIRCIEVKARAERALVVLTSNEWGTAEQLKDGYFLYVVLSAATQPELYVIQNPADKISVEERIDVRYQVPLWEIMEHGEPV